MQAKGMAADDAAFKEIVAARALTVLRRLTKGICNVDKAN
jgi:hypothetical protein